MYFLIKTTLPLTQALIFGDEKLSITDKKSILERTI